MTACLNKLGAENRAALMIVFSRFYLSRPLLSKEKVGGEFVNLQVDLEVECAFVVPIEAFSRSTDYLILFFLTDVVCMQTNYLKMTW